MDIYINYLELILPYIDLLSIKSKLIMFGRDSSDVMLGLYMLSRRQRRQRRGEQDAHQRVLELV
jgi:hypothetical protein